MTSATGSGPTTRPWSTWSASIPLPALGTVRADMGAYGGPGADGLAAVPTATEPPPPDAGSADVRAYPNPSRAETTLAVTAPPGPVVLAVYDASGRRVRLLNGPRHPGGLLRVTWDGRDGDGRRVPSGRYLLRLVAPVEATEQVTVLR